MLNGNRVSVQFGRMEMDVLSGSKLKNPSDGTGKVAGCVKMLLPN